MENLESKKAKKAIYDKAHYAKNRERLIAYCREYNKAHPEVQKKAMTKWRKRNPEKAKEATSKWREENPEKSKKSTLNWRERNPEKVKIHHKTKTLKLYGATIEDWENLKLKQNNSCAICGTHESNITLGLAIDHDHVTGKIRSLLCVKCNTGLGCFNDNVVLLNKAIMYIGEHTIIKRKRRGV